MAKIFRNVLLMKAGERDQAWLRVLVPTLVMSVIYLYGKGCQHVTFIEPAKIIYIGYLLFSILILARKLLNVTPSKLWHAASLVIDSAALTLLSYWYHDYPITLLAIFALPFMGYGICCRQRNLYIAVLISLSLSGLLLTLQSSHVSAASVLTPIGIIIVVSFFALYLNAWSRELMLAKEEADQAKQSRSTFFANMSHELRTPLHGILGLSGLLNDAKLGNIEQRYTMQITDAAKIMLSLVDNVLDFTRIEENKFVLQHSLTDVHELLFKIYRMFYYQAKKNHLALRFKIDPLLHYKLVISEKHIQQVLINLVANALKFTNSGFVAINMNMAGDNKLRFEVLDSGRGIAEDEQERIFDRFSQGEEWQNSQAGTGLGLTISKQIVEVMGGSIGVRSLKNRGSMFWFEVPYRQCVTFEKNILSAGRVLVIRSSETATRFELIAITYGAEIIVHKSVRPLCKDLNRSKFHVVILDKEFKDEYRKMIEPFSLQEGPLIITIEAKLDKNIEQNCDHYGCYYQIDQAVEKSIFINLIHRAIVCKMDYRHKPSLPNIRNNVEAGSKKIIIAEDNEINRDVISQILGRAGYQLTLASDGQETLNYLRKEFFDLLIVDNQMPKMNGLQTIQRYKKLYPDSTMPIIVLSADVSLDSRKKYSNEGVQRYICKPVDAVTLLTIISNIISSHPVVSANGENKVTQRDNKLSQPHGAKEFIDIVENYGVAEAVMSQAYTSQKVFDQQYLLDIIKMASSVEYAFSISKRCLNQANRGINLFSQSIDSNREQAAREIHHIKGSLASIGAIRFSVFCSILDKEEKLLLLNHQDSITKILWKEYYLLKKSVEDWFASTTTSKYPVTN
ncbi:hypothetical protein MNBD_GAMMA12-492 [hydrothermal vent metagenome]|uniref:Histidine kinase n=1 Tax=hydrothermal vent metagenome TaxID=652676 RepID=A0A3B0ZDC6_9ZZZZ